MLACGVVAMLGSCESDPLIFPDRQGASSTGTGQGSDSICDPCASTDGTRIVRVWETVASKDGLSHSRFVGFHDNLRDEACSPLIAEDTKLRCLPSGHRIEKKYFGDANCTIEVVPIFASECIVPPPKYAIEPIKWANACVGPGTVVYELAGEYLAQLYEMPMEKCIPSQASNYNLFLLGKKVDPFDFAEMKIETAH